MSELAVVTPTYRPDADLFAQLHRSVLEHTPPDTVHHVVVPTSDRALFAGYAGPRCRVWTYAEILPRRIVHVPGTALWVDLARPWPPLRGWVVQQAAKIAVTLRLDVRVALIADSDVVLVRDADAASFLRDGRTILHRDDGAVHAGMPEHVTWHAVARGLLGLPATAAPPLPDYVTSLACWDPELVRAMTARIAEVSGRDWLSAFTAHLRVSEFVVYGVFVDEVLKASLPGETALCHSRWDRTPLDHDGAVAFADRLGPRAVGMMISAKSRTPMAARLAAIQRCAQVTRPDGSPP